MSLRLPGIAPGLLCLSLVATPLAAGDAAAARSFAWLSGHWCSSSGDRRIEEYWMPAGGSLALGVGRTIRAGKTTAFEFMRIESADGEVHFIAQPQGGAPTLFRLTAGGTDWARFENPAHDFPQRVEYRRTEAGLQAQIAGPGEQGPQEVITFSYRRCAD